MAGKPTSFKVRIYVIMHTLILMYVHDDIYTYLIYKTKIKYDLEEQIQLIRNLYLAPAEKSELINPKAFRLYTHGQKAVKSIDRNNEY